MFLIIGETTWVVRRLTEKLLEDQENGEIQIYMWKDDSFHSVETLSAEDMEYTTDELLPID